jgi:hypothetical protein
MKHLIEPKKLKEQKLIKEKYKDLILLSYLNIFTGFQIIITTLKKKKTI